MCSPLIREASVKLSAYISAMYEATAQSDVMWGDEFGDSFRVWFLHGTYARHNITAQDMDGKIVIKTWVTGPGNDGFYLDDTEVTNPDAIVDVICDLREKVTLEAVEVAYRQKKQ